MIFGVQVGTEWLAWICVNATVYKLIEKSRELIDNG
jgi:hypothetical protein